MLPRRLMTAPILAALLAAPTLFAGPDGQGGKHLHVSFVATTGVAAPGDTTFYTVGSEQLGVGRLATMVDVDGEEVTFEVLVSLEYTDGSGPFTGFLSLAWPDGDVVVCRYEGVVVRDTTGDSRWRSNLHVIDGAGSLVGATGRGKVSGFRSAALGGSVEYTVDLTIQRRKGPPKGGGSPEGADGGSSGVAFGSPGDLALDLVLTGAAEEQRLRNVGHEDSVRYGIFRITGTEANGPLPVQVSALGALGYRVGSGPFAGFLVLDYGGDHVLYCRYDGHDPAVDRIDAHPRPARRDCRHRHVRRHAGQGEGPSAPRRARGLDAADVHPSSVALRARAKGAAPLRIRSRPS